MGVELGQVLTTFTSHLLRNQPVGTWVICCKGNCGLREESWDWGCQISSPGPGLYNSGLIEYFLPGTARGKAKFIVDLVEQGSINVPIA